MRSDSNLAISIVFIIYSIVRNLSDTVAYNFVLSIKDKVLWDYKLQTVFENDTVGVKPFYYFILQYSLDQSIFLKVRLGASEYYLIKKIRIH